MAFADGAEIDASPFSFAALGNENTIRSRNEFLLEYIPEWTGRSAREPADYRQPALFRNRSFLKKAF